MALRHAIINVLDRPGGRAVLGTAATLYARRKTGQNITFFFDDVWGHRNDDGIAIADSPVFDYNLYDVEKWKDELSQFEKNHHDFLHTTYEPQPGDVIIDVGAGTGAQTMILSRCVERHGRVIAIEAHPTTFRCLTKLCQWNQLRNIECLNVAVTDQPRTVFIEDQSDYTSNAILNSPNGEVLPEGIPGVPLDDICRERDIRRINFLKMNIEGAEKLAIDGMEETIQRTERVCIACHDFRADRGEAEYFRTKDTVIQFLENHNFKTSTRDDDPRPWVRDQVHGIRG